ncbi:MAG: alkyl sulfatase dimerization domain-containing protein [Lachnospiraceae bacterium]
MSSKVAKTTFNPIYMGEDIDYKGDALVLETGSKGQIANKVLLDHHKQFEQKCYKVCDGVYQSVGFGLCNAVMVEGKTGMIIIDTNDSIEAANMDYNEFKKVCDKPVSAIIYSHWHYVMGTRAYVPAGKEQDIEIWAHQDHLPDVMDAFADSMPSYFRRLYVNTGNFIEREGENGYCGGALGPFYTSPYVENPTQEYMAPNKVISNETVTKQVIDGVEFEFHPSFSESSDSIIIYIPEKKVAHSNHAWPVFANLYTLRGELFRHPLKWIHGIDVMREKGIEHLTGCHGVPISGKERLDKVLTEYRDGIQFLYDRTIKGMNQGKAPDEIIRDLKVPKHLVTGEITKEIYGEMEYYVKGIYRGFIGWFGNDAVELHPVTKEFEAERIIEGFGGKDVVVKTAQEALDRKEYSWAAQLATYVLKVDVENPEAKKVKAFAFYEMAHRTTATTTRYWYTTQANTLMGGFDPNTVRPRVPYQVAKVCPPQMFIKAFGVDLIPELCEDVNKVVIFDLTDIGVTCGLHIRYGVAEFLDQAVTGDVKVSMTHDTLCGIIAGEKSYTASIQNKDIMFAGDRDLAEKLGEMIDF